ncbi:MAG: CoA ester lyase [Amphiplicatus sp.]
MTFRSLLFVPGSRPDRFEKAAASGADAVCIDLEDAVAPRDKDKARADVFAFLKSGPKGASVGFRLNALSSLDGFRDVIAFADSGARPAFIMIPKASGADELRQLRAALGAEAPPFWPLLEHPSALPRLYEIAQASGPSGGVMLGGVDYSAALGREPEWEALHHARASLVAATAAAGCGSVDAPYIDVKNKAGLAAETSRVRDMGFTGRACIHPAQIAAINAIFTPSAEEMSKAEKIAAAYDAAGGGVSLLDGSLIEEPVRRQAERVLKQARKD